LFQYPFSAITVNNYLYVLGTRRSSSEEYKSCYRFSARTCEWTKLQNLLHDRSRFAAAYVNSYIYMYVGLSILKDFFFCLLFSMGGFEGFKRTTRVYVNTIERYSIEDDQWESFSTDGPQLSSLAACAYENSIFLGGGKNGQWYVDIFYT
jgi:N-acetylneuraminic acid mutarotase